MLKKLLLCAFALASLGGAAHQALAAVPYSEDWSAGNVNGWVQGTSSTVVVRDGTDGNPAGSLALRRDLSPPVFDLSATSELPAISGDYSGSPGWIVSWDAKYDIGKFSDVWLRFRYQDSTFNGWHLDVGNAFPNNSWESYSIPFNPAWTNAQAAANGWVDETGGAVSWQTLMSNVYHPEIRMLLSDDNSAIAHIDNFRLRAVPEPGTLVLGAMGCTLGAFTYLRRKRAA